MKLKRLPPHDVMIRDSYEPRPVDRQPGTTTIRCLLCHRLVFYSMASKWVHCIDAADGERHLWRLVTRYGHHLHYDVGDGKTACGIHRRRQVKEASIESSNEFTGGQRCKKCRAALHPKEDE